MPRHVRLYEQILSRAFLHAQGAQALCRGKNEMLSPACLHADNILDADSSVGLTSGYGGDSYDAAWVHDPDVGVVIECNKVSLWFTCCTSCGMPCTALCNLLILPASADCQLRYSKRVLLCLMHLYAQRGRLRHDSMQCTQASGRYYHWL